MTSEERRNLDVAIRFFRFWAFVRMSRIRRQGRKPTDFELRMITREMVERLRQYGLVASPPMEQGYQRVLH